MSDHKGLWWKGFGMVSNYVSNIHDKVNFIQITTQVQKKWQTLLTLKVWGLKPLCHLSNSLLQFSTVLRGHTTKALLRGNRLQNNTV